MKLLGLLIVGFALGCLGLGVAHPDRAYYLLAAFGLVCGTTTFLSPGISSYLKIFSAIFSTEFLVFGAAAVAQRMHVLPGDGSDFDIPASLPMTVGMFSAAVYLISKIPAVDRIMRIADRYYETTNRTRNRIWPFPSFEANERTFAILMVVFLVVVNQFQVLMHLRLSFFSRDFINALNAKSAPDFWHQLLFVFPLLAFPLIASYVMEFVVQSTLMIRWRAWLTNDYAGRWLGDHAHYRLSLSGQLTDNPDQRISEDIIRFIDGYGTPNGLGVYTISVTLISKFSNLVSFAILLWVLSEGFALPGTSIVIPGFLFWCALIYAFIGTGITHVLGRRIRPLTFTRQRFEADFRFSMARVREYGEQIALLKGEPTEQRGLDRKFDAIVGNYFQIVSVRKTLLAFTSFYGQLNPFIPYIVGAPFYFIGRISFGVLSQIAQAFGNVSDALTFFVDYYVQVAEFQSVVDRLTSFDDALTKVERQTGTLSRDASPVFDLQNVNVRLPDGRALLSDVNVRFGVGQSSLVKGPSGSGKSTLFRVIAGIWPHGEGTISIPAGASMMVVPQKPYLPVGTLRDVVAYPAAGDTYDAETVADVLRAVKLGDLVDLVDVEDNWTQRLSGGEQQRIAVARAILARPDWLFLDEATSAMDLDLEKATYETIAARLPHTTIISNAHRETLDKYHPRRLDMRPVGGGRFGLSETRFEPAQ